MRKPENLVNVTPTFVDFEMTNLTANYGRFICGCIKTYQKPVQTFRIDQTKAGKKCAWDDSDLVAQIRDCLEQQWFITTWNGIMFDVKFLNARLMKHRLRALHKPMHKDLLFTAKGTLALSDCRLVTVQEFLELEVAKTRLDCDQWIAAAAGHSPAIDYVVEHCEHDVMVLEEVFEHLLPHVKEIHA